MKILVVGSGGREHALVWKIAQSNRVSKIYCAPGNAGTAHIAENIDISVEDLHGITGFCKKEKIDLVVVGPEFPLTLGMANKLNNEKIPVIGPGQDAARLESSKIFAKEIMKKAGVPTADYGVFSDSSKALEFITKTSFPTVIKADGLAAGKGVIIAESEEEAKTAIESIMVQKAFMDAGDRIIVEEFLTGEEASILAFVDGKDYIPMVSSQDHKRIYDGDKGPNTGGMGAYSPAPVITKELFEQIDKEVLKPTVERLYADGLYYQGILYAGIMVTEHGPQVLEFNVRFGDPETQSVLPRLKTDIIDVFEAQINHTLPSLTLEWDDRAALCVVLAAGGYPGSYKKGDIISGLSNAEAIDNVAVFHAGTKLKNNSVLTNGGRVLGVTALGADIASAQDTAYKAVENIHFNNAYYRTDIGFKAQERAGQAINNQ